ncbi:NADH-ubiquinone oxidoreductase chain 5 [Glycine soja]|uniref:NADH-ubiquinone oxidoreductase chain 5 n=1 Tax=Glycine soja TaxID=3848 RepID=A0A445EXJ9_GLYSO|nr:NADH-ubiquinone oxidoreductase chain 5 [Glycine soja]
MNHAFFKALLFLSAGSVIHAMSDEQDMRKMGGLASSFPFTYAMMLMGSLSLIGFPFLTGFYSKDVILELAYTKYTISRNFAFWTGTSGINVFQFLALHRPSNGPWTKRPLPERTMSRGPPPPTRYISRLWAAITIQEDTRNWKDKQTHPVDCRATSPTTQERDSLKSQGRGWPRGPTWRLGISAGNAKVS